jgi:hypothetical protein
LQRLLGNLVVNAVKYGDKEAPVRIRIAEDGERVRFEVRNTGTAIEGAGVGGAVIDEVQLRVVSEPTPYRASADLPCVGRPALDAQVGAAVGGIERLKVRADQHILDLLAQRPLTKAHFLPVPKVFVPHPQDPSKPIIQGTRQKKNESLPGVPHLEEQRPVAILSCRELQVGHNSLSRLQDVLHAGTDAGKEVGGIRAAVAVRAVEARDPGKSRGRPALRKPMALLDFDGRHGLAQVFPIV